MHPTRIPSRSLAACGLLFAGILAASCGGSEATSPLEAPLGLKGKIELVTNAENPLTEAKAELGKVLFFDKRLSGTGQMSCNTCHLHEHGWTDGKQFSPKDDGSLNFRNTPTMYNVGYLEKLYWDGRANVLEKNVEAAWKAQMIVKGTPEEQDAKIVQISEGLNAVPAYAKMFQDAFQAKASKDNVVQALASFLRTLQSGNSAYDRWQAGDRTAVNNDIIEGHELFTGKAGCNNCHILPLFTNRGFHNVGIGMAKENPDIGAGKPTNDPSKRGAFKTPGLRSVSKTAPYFHDGSVATLEEAIALMAGGGLDVPGNTKDVLLVDRKLTKDEIGKIAAFLRSLDSTEPFVAPKVP
ncbi:MAG: hypothetical protein RIT25_305 [Planctomycetota bacterium]|jgi:cytochrome c peroxidase